MTRRIWGVVAAGLLATAVVAQEDVIAQRRNIMKSNGAATRTGVQMSKGEIPFDLAKARDVFKNYDDATERFPKLFPENSKTGGETTSNAKVWENSEDFQARFVAWKKDIAQASEQTKDLDSFKTAFGNVTKACGSCHQVYRKS